MSALKISRSAVTTQVNGVAAEAPAAPGSATTEVVRCEHAALSVTALCVRAPADLLRKHRDHASANVKCEQRGSWRQSSWHAAASVAGRPPWMVGAPKSTDGS